MQENTDKSFNKKNIFFVYYIIHTLTPYQLLQGASFALYIMINYIEFVNTHIQFICMFAWIVYNLNRSYCP